MSRSTTFLKKTKKNRTKKNKVKRSKNRKDRCCNPFKFGGIHRSLRAVSKSLLQKFDHLDSQAKICNSCRKYWDSINTSKKTRQNNKKIQNRLNTVSDSDNVHIETDFDTCDDEQNQSDEVQNIEYEGVDDSDIPQNNRAGSIDDHDLQTIFQNLKIAFSSLNETDPMRVKILTMVPEHWSIRRTAEEFDTTTYYVRKAEDLRKTYGVFAEVPKRKGKQLPQTLIKAIDEFYHSDDVSRVTPSMTNTVSMEVDGKKQKVQKRLLLLSLKELFTTFKKENPKLKVSFSMFAKLRPKNCILPGKSGTHSVCVCTIHQNVKTMFDAIDFKKLTDDEECKLSDYQDCLKKIVCSDPNEDCYFNNCKKCPSMEQFENQLKDLLSKNLIEEVKYAVWTEADRSTLVTIQENADDFIENFCERLQLLKPHSYIAKKQSLFIKNRKENLKNGEVFVCFDFSENYAYVAQDAAQSFHYNNDQGTVFPILFYFKNHNEIVQKSCIFLSDSNKHDSAAVHSILNQFIPYLKKEVPKVKKIIYVSDGAKQHFKNRYQMANLLNHKKDFGIDAEWHFTPTAHGKGGHDGLAACLKREARRESLKVKPTDAILNIHSLFSWAKKYFKEKVAIFYFSKTDHDRTRRHLNQRFMNAKEVKGISSHHSFKPMNDGSLEMKRFSTV